jgi:hypothetical protein
MNIIFGREQADALANKYTVLELDTIQFGKDGSVITAYCTVENIPFEELSETEQRKIQHEHLILNYRGRAWKDCLEALDQLTGKWGGELDSFYENLRSRVETYITNPPDADWSSVIHKPVS